MVNPISEEIQKSGPGRSETKNFMDQIQRFPLLPLSIKKNLMCTLHSAKRCTCAVYSSTDSLHSASGCMALAGWNGRSCIVLAVSRSSCCKFYSSRNLSILGRLALSAVTFAQTRFMTTVAFARTRAMTTGAVIAWPWVVSPNLHCNKVAAAPKIESHAAGRR